jgi:hypothetical protein
VTAPAEVRAMNHVSRRGLLLASGTYVAFELLEGTLTVGDVIDGDLAYGPCVWKDVTTGEVVRAYVQQLMAPVEVALRFYEQPPPARQS